MFEVRIRFIILPMATRVKPGMWFVCDNSLQDEHEPSALLWVASYIVLSWWSGGVGNGKLGRSSMNGLMLRTAEKGRVANWGLKFRREIFASLIWRKGVKLLNLQREFSQFHPNPLCAFWNREGPHICYPHCGQAGENVCPASIACGASETCQSCNPGQI